MTFRIWLAGTCSVLVLGALPAHGQETQGPQSEVIVVTGSQVELPDAYAGGQVARGGRVGLFGAMDVMDAPFSSTSYTEELIRNQQALSVADVLQNDPTLRVAKGFGNFQELYVIRGFPVFSDDMTYNGVYGILPRQFVAAELLERVEVFRGANAFLNGAAPGGSGVGGAFNLVPKRAPDEALTRITAGVQSGGELYGAADVARRFGAEKEWGVRGNLAHRNGESVIEGQERELTVLAAGTDYRGDRFRFSVDAGFQDQHIDAPRPQVTPAGGVPEAPDSEGNYAQPWTFSDEQQIFGVARGEFDVSSAVTVWAAAGGRNGEEANSLANPSAQPSGVTSAYRFDNTREDNVASADAGVRAEFATGPVEHRLIASGSAVSLESRNAYAFSSFAGFAGDLYNPFPAARPAADFFTGGVLSDPGVTEETDTRSFAVADMLTFLDGTVIATLGARWQEIETKTFDYNTGALGSAYKADAVTPAVGLVWKPADTLSIYANYSESLTPGGVAPATSGGAPVLNAGEVLDPFRGKQGEIGAKMDLGAFGGTLSVFSLTLPSAFVQNGVFGDNGEQENQGVELSVFGEPAPGVRLLGGLTVLDAELKETAGGALDGRTAIGVPKVQANVSVEWDVPALDGLTLDGRIVHTGEQYASADNSLQLDAWTRLDIGARYALTVAERTVTLRARVENLTDETYWASSGGYPGANYLVLGGPRTALVSASVDF